MKKTMVALLALSGITMADDITLLYGLDFNEKDNLGVIYKNVAENPGSGVVSTVGDKHRNYVEGMDGSLASDVRGSNYYFQINSAENSQTGLGVNTSDGFTLTFNTKLPPKITLDNGGVDDTHWESFLAFNIGGQNMVFQYGDRKADANGYTTINVFTWNGENATGGGGNIGANENDGKLSVAAITQDDTSSWYTVALTAKNGNLTLSVLDSTASLIATTTVTSQYTGSLNSVSGYANYKFVSHSYIDNLAIYDDALTTEQLATLTKYEVANGTMLQTIPEPATATLSLLALAGLAMRRRRK